MESFDLHFIWWKKVLWIIKMLFILRKHIFGDYLGTQNGSVASLQKPPFETFIFKNANFAWSFMCLHLINIIFQATPEGSVCAYLRVRYKFHCWCFWHQSSILVHVCFRKGWGSVGAHHMDLVSGYLGKKVGVVRMMCPRAPSSYSSSSDYSLTLARLVVRCYFWCSGGTRLHVLPFPELRRCLSWPNGSCPRCHGLVFGWEEQLSTLTRPSSSWWTKRHGGIRVSKTATWTPRGPGTRKQCLNENVCHYSN